MLWDFLLEALRLGAKVSLAAIPYSLVYNYLRMFNFAFGEIFTFAGYVFFLLLQNAHWPVWAALCAALGLSGVLGLIIERVAYRRLMDTRERHLLLVTSVGVSIVLQNLYQAIFGSRTIYLNSSEPHGAWIWLVLILEVCVLQWLLHRTAFGDRVAAVASNRSLAELLGVHPGFVYSSVFAAASALAVPAGVFELLDNGIAPDMGFQLGLLAFAAAVLAGMGSILRTVAASFVLAFLAQLAQISGVLNDRLVWVLCVIAAILFSVARRIGRRRAKARSGEDIGK